MKNDDENGLEAATFEEEDEEEDFDDFQTKTLKAFHLFAVPNLESESRTNYKGKAGKKIGIVGGDRKYAGAPYFAAMAACRAGADLVHVFCHEEAAGAIKSYSPDVIVHACLKDERDARESGVSLEDLQDQFLKENREMISRMDAIVIGPGLGRDSYTWSFARLCFSIARTVNAPVVFDADALFMIHASETLKPLVRFTMEKAPPVGVNGYVVFTPNVREYTYGFDPNDTTGKTVDNVDAFLESSDGHVGSCHTFYPSILAKGADDIYVHLVKGLKEGPTKFENVPGSKKRCGGQGDILSGVLAVFLAWSNDRYRRDLERDPETMTNDLKVEQYFRKSSKLACFSASKLTREAARRAYEKQKRSLQSSDILLELPNALEDLFPSVLCDPAKEEEGDDDDKGQREIAEE